MCLLKPMAQSEDIDWPPGFLQQIILTMISDKSIRSSSFLFLVLRRWYASTEQDKFQLHLPAIEHKYQQEAFHHHLLLDDKAQTAITNDVVIFPRCIPFLQHPIMKHLDRVPGISKRFPLQLGKALGLLFRQLRQGQVVSGNIDPQGIFCTSDLCNLLCSPLADAQSAHGNRYAIDIYCMYLTLNMISSFSVLTIANFIDTFHGNDLDTCCANFRKHAVWTVQNNYQSWWSVKSKVATNQGPLPV